MSRLTKELFITNHTTLKPSIRSFFSKIGSKNSLLGKLLTNYTSFITHSNFTIIVRALNVPNKRRQQLNTGRNLSTLF